MRKMALLCMFVIVASAAPIYAATPSANNTPVNTTNCTTLVNHTCTPTPMWNNITNTSVNKTNTSVNTTNSTKNKEIQNLTAEVKINQAKIQGLTKEDNILEKQSCVT